MGTTTAAVKGAAGGAASGAVAGPEGAAAGAAAGGAGGAKAGHDAKKAARAADGGGGKGTPADSSSPSAGDHAKKYGKKAKKAIPGPTTRGGRGSNPRRMLVGEFVVCTLILALAPLSAKHKDDDVVKWMARGGAISLVYLVLGLIATLSDKAGRVAAAMGLVIMVGLLVSDADVFQNFLAGLQVPQRKDDGIAPGTGDSDVPPTDSGAGTPGEGNFDLGFGPDRTPRGAS